MIYGRFNEAELFKREYLYGPDYPYLEYAGKTWHITELVKTMLGFANYQAEEVDPRERDKWLEEHRPKDGGAGVPVPVPPPPRGPEPLVAAVPVPVPTPEPSEPPPEPPRLAEF